MIKTVTKSIRKTAPFIISVMTLFVLSINIAHGADNDAGALTKILGFANFFDLISQAIAQFFFQLQTIASWLIILAGFLLNYSVNLTLNIKLFVDNTPAIYTTWKALRDITGMIIIFFLLYEAIQLIIGIQGAKLKQLAVNIVIAGVLINFSFFFAGLGIDASNIVSMQLYKAIAPASSLNETKAGLAADGVTQIAKHGGLSDIFMQALKIPALYDVAGKRTAAGASLGGGTWTQPFQIMLVGVTSVIIMVTAAFSFALAALMFVVRFVILIFLLAFSPVWFMSFISPEIKKYGGKWIDYYKSMLLIMPVYLLLMYMSLNVLSSQRFFGGLDTTNNTSTISAGTTMVDQALAATGGTSSSSNWYDGILAVAINSAIVIVMMNIPLMGAISVGGGAVKFLNADKFGADAIWKKVGNYAGTNTAGRFGNWADKKMENTRFGNSILGRDIRSSTVGALSTAKMGGRSFDETKKLGKEVAKKQREMDNANALKVALNSADPDKHVKIRELLGKMSTKEIESLDKDILTNEHMVPHISSSVYKNIDKGDKSDADKTKILGARVDALNKAAIALDNKKVKQIMKNMTGDDVAGLFEEMPAGAVVNDIFIQNLKPGQLKDMEHLDENVRKQIGQRIHTWGRRPGATSNHAAYDYIDKNPSLWL